jgi:hypothetical protein
MDYSNTGLKELDFDLFFVSIYLDTKESATGTCD